MDNLRECIFLEECLEHIREHEHVDPDEWQLPSHITDQMPLTDQITEI